MGAKLFDKIDALAANVDAKVGALDTKFDAKFNALDAKIDAKTDGLKDSIAAAKVWALVLYIAFAATMLGTMARGFEWI